MKNDIKPINKLVAKYTAGLFDFAHNKYELLVIVSIHVLNATSTKS